MRSLNAEKTGELLKQRIKHYGNNRRFAKIIGVSETSVSNWTRGIKMPSVDSFVYLAGIFGCKVDDLLVIEER